MVTMAPSFAPAAAARPRAGVPHQPPPPDPEGRAGPVPGGRRVGGDAPSGERKPESSRHVERRLGHAGPEQLRIRTDEGDVQGAPAAATQAAS